MIETHVPSLALCRRFSELCKEKGFGVPETEMYWRRQVVDGIAKDTWIISGFLDPNFELGCCDGLHQDTPAPLVSELGEWLPNERRDKFAFFSGLAINGWFCEIKNYKVMPYERLHVELQHDTEANARLSMLIYLIEQGYISSLKK